MQSDAACAAIDVEDGLGTVARQCVEEVLGDVVEFFGLVGIDLKKGFRRDDVCLIADFFDDFFFAKREGRGVFLEARTDFLIEGRKCHEVVFVFWQRDEESAECLRGARANADDESGVTR